MGRGGLDSLVKMTSLHLDFVAKDKRYTVGLLCSLHLFGERDRERGGGRREKGEVVESEGKA